LFRLARPQASVPWPLPGTGFANATVLDSSDLHVREKKRDTICCVLNRDTVKRPFES